MVVGEADSFQSMKL